MGSGICGLITVRDLLHLKTEIVGVVADARDHEITARPERRAYFSYVHASTPGDLVDQGALRMIVRTAGDPAARVQQIRQAVVAVDPQLPIDGVDPLATLMRATLAGQRMVARLATGFGVLALLLAAIGLYGVMTYAMSRRTGEIGLRVALGAEGRDIIRMVLTESLVLVGTGVVIGLPLALAVTRLLQNQLHDVPAADPASMAVAIGVLMMSAIAAVTLPALRASRVSPIVALRAD
jgi:predicted lysophospholipase L1 biosynthesis ABC-type transport system permease subunit